MPVLNPEHLLDQADRLIALLPGGAPRQADLRRAISSAYYAVFHAIVTEAADDFVGRTKRDTTRYGLLYRSVDHGYLKQLSQDVAKKTLPNKYLRYAPRGGFGGDIIAVATAVIDLQERRHTADYDPLFRARKSDATLAVATSRTALVRLKGADPEQRKTFLSLVVFSPR